MRKKRRRRTRTKWNDKKWTINADENLIHIVFALRLFLCGVMCECVSVAIGYDCGSAVVIVAVIIIIGCCISANDHISKNLFIIFSSTHHSRQNWISLFEFYFIQPNSWTELLVWVILCGSVKEKLGLFSTSQHNTVRCLVPSFSK